MGAAGLGFRVLGEWFRVSGVGFTADGLRPIYKFAFGIGFRV